MGSSGEGWEERESEDRGGERRRKARRTGAARRALRGGHGRADGPQAGRGVLGALAGERGEGVERRGRGLWRGGENQRELCTAAEKVGGVGGGERCAGPAGSGGARLRGAGGSEGRGG